MHANEMHAYEMHTRDVYAYEIHTREMHAHETPAYEMLLLSRKVRIYLRLFVVLV
jgi:hypothetical protein